jgi:hypothetical protein
MVPHLVSPKKAHQRAAVRYQLRLPVIFHWSDEATGRDHTEGGFTRDIAVDGAFIMSNRCPAVGAEVRIEILFPSPDEPCGELRIDCVGKVTRVENEQSGRGGFGVYGTFDDDHLARQTARFG